MTNQQVDISGLSPLPSESSWPELPSSQPPCLRRPPVRQQCIARIRRHIVGEEYLRPSTQKPNCGPKLQRDQGSKYYRRLKMKTIYETIHSPNLSRNLKVQEFRSKSRVAEIVILVSSSIPGASRAAIGESGFTPFLIIFVLKTSNLANFWALFSIFIPFLAIFYPI